MEEWEANRSPAKTPLEGPDLLAQLEEKEAHVKYAYFQLIRHFWKTIGYFRALEIELAQTKLDLVEAQCRNQDLTHQMTQSESDGKRQYHFSPTIV